MAYERELLRGERLRHLSSGIIINDLSAAGKRAPAPLVHRHSSELRQLAPGLQINATYPSWLVGCHLPLAETHFCTSLRRMCTRGACDPRGVGVGEALVDTAEHPDPAECVELL